MRHRRYTSDNERLSRIIAQTRDLCRSSAQMLDQPQPDTFLGRRTHEQISRDDGLEDSLVKVAERPRRDTSAQ